MRFGVTLAQANPSVWTELAVTADRLGFESVWQSDHLVIPDTGLGADHQHARLRNPETPLFDVFGVLGWLAAQTTQIRLGTFVYVPALRHPFVVARGFATVDQLSGGRVIPGFGAGSIAEEFSAVGIEPDTRGRRLDETVQICRKLWSAQRVDHHGEFFHFDAVTLRPPPTQAAVPIHIGGESPRALRRAAHFGDGWLGQQHTPGSLAPLLRALHELEEAAARTSALEISVLASNPTIEEIRQFGELGVDRLIVAPWRRSSQALQAIESFAQIHLG